MPSAILSPAPAGLSFALSLRSQRQLRYSSREMKSRQEWIGIAEGLRTGRIPFSKATTYRLAKDALLTIRRIDGRASVLQSEINAILRLLRKSGNV